MGKIILANIGSIQNCKAALRNKERANNESKTVLLCEFTPAAVPLPAGWPWMAGACPSDKGHMMEKHFLAGKLRRKA